MTSSQLSQGELVTKALVRLVAGFIILSGRAPLASGDGGLLGGLGVPGRHLRADHAHLHLPAQERSWAAGAQDEDIRRRMWIQNLIVKLGAVCYGTCFTYLPGFDRRFGWSHVPVAAVVVANLLVLLGYLLFILVLRENSYASRVVEVEQGQRVVMTGPYCDRPTSHVPRGACHVHLHRPVALELPGGR